MASWGACARLAILLSGGRPHDQCPVQALHLRGVLPNGSGVLYPDARPQNQSERLSLVLCVPQFTVCGEAAMHPSPRFHAYRLWPGGCSSTNSRHSGVTVRFCVEFGPAGRRSPPCAHEIVCFHVPSASVDRARAGWLLSRV